MLQLAAGLELGFGPSGGTTATTPVAGRHTVQRRLVAFVSAA